MAPTPIGLSRISKLHVDRDRMSTAEALRLRRGFELTLLCGPDVATSYTLQVAVMTATAITVRCFPGAVRVALPRQLKKAPLLPWPRLRLGFADALAKIAGPKALTGIEGRKHPRGVVFGDVPKAENMLRATFDGWISKVGPADMVARLRERDYFASAGVLAGALSVSELFLSFADVSIEATRRTVGLSLWRPELDIADPAALGIPVEYLPDAFWVLGLGHLGNAYLWTLAALPYADPSAVEFMLVDFERVEPENIETGIILDRRDKLRWKTRACGTWLERRGFQTRLVERPFDSSFRCRDDEPKLALCGFDTNDARRDLATAQFRRVIESGLGGAVGNFDTISLHTLPNPRPPSELWPKLSKDDIERQKREQVRIARENAGYKDIGADDCGRFNLAGKAVAAPFVGAAAASLVVAEAVRLFHDGPAYTDLKIGLGTPGKRFTRPGPVYTAEDTNGLAFGRSRRLVW